MSHLDLNDVDHVRAIAREEVASLCGVVVRRLQDAKGSSQVVQEVRIETLIRIFSEAEFEAKT